MSKRWTALCSLSLLLAFAPACSTESSSGEAHVGDQDDEDDTSRGEADAGDSSDEPDCFENPTTHYEIINACTPSVKVEKSPDLRGLNSDGTLPEP